MQQRRSFLKHSALGLGALPVVNLLGSAAWAAGEVELTEDDPMAVALGYKHVAEEGGGRRHSPHGKLVLRQLRPIRRHSGELGNLQHLPRQAGGRQGLVQRLGADTRFLKAVRPRGCQTPSR